MPKKNTKFGADLVDYQQPLMQPRPPRPPLRRQDGFRVSPPKRDVVGWVRLIAEIAGFVGLIILLAHYLEFTNIVKNQCQEVVKCGSVCGSEYVCITTPEPCEPCEKGSPGSPGS